MCEGEEKRGGAKWARIFCDKVYNGIAFLQKKKVYNGTQAGTE